MQVGSDHVFVDCVCFGSLSDNQSLNRSFLLLRSSGCVPVFQVREPARQTNDQVLQRKTKTRPQTVSIKY